MQINIWKRQPALHPGKNAVTPGAFPLERVWAKRRKATPAIFTGRCWLTVASAHARN